MKEVEIGGNVFTLDKLKASAYAEIQDKYVSFTGKEKEPAKFDKLGSYQLDMCKACTIKIKSGDKLIEDKAEIAGFIENMYVDEYSELFLQINTITKPSDEEVKNS